MVAVGADGGEHPARITWLIVSSWAWWQRGQGEEESVESCRIERHVGSAEVSDLAINGLSSSGFVFLTSTVRWGPVFEESPSWCSVSIIP